MEVGRVGLALVFQRNTGPALQNGFQAVTATAPLGFMRAQQMAAVRRALCDRAQATRPIRDIAAAFGFDNPSQFSQDYRAHFGEAPSRTRERSVGTHSPAATACC
ncbi:helix-turn-helix domain-containing protein [Crenobacter caeni]|uniref:AraC family transcriptional regulator n=1 Tax=Crenobacter caeni TaxID=2705474 RepID=A0A6B2KP21_9NEIS|nr:AraC family transcriptional regulator [Crenobacter caeni]